MNEFEQCISEWADRCREAQAECRRIEVVNAQLQARVKELEARSEEDKVLGWLSGNQVASMANQLAKFETTLAERDRTIAELQAASAIHTGDAKVWATDFMCRFGGRRDEIDESLMLAWFACAIMQGWDEATRRAEQVKQEQDRTIVRLTEEKDDAYLQRNYVVAALARCFPSGVRKTNIEGWSADWHGCVYVDLPTGQVSWHYHDSQGRLFDGLPSYTQPWDGHTTEEKYQRVAALPQGIGQQLAERDAEIARLTKERDTSRVVLEADKRVLDGHLQRCHDLTRQLAERDAEIARLNKLVGELYGEA